MLEVKLLNQIIISNGKLHLIQHIHILNLGG